VVSLLAPKSDEITTIEAPTTPIAIPLPIGLTDDEAQRRRERGQGNDIKIKTSRSYWDILRQNTFTFINNVLFFIGFIMIMLGLWGDAFVSVGVVMLNVVVGIVQEFRAKAKLDKISLLTRPKATIIRNGKERDVDPTEIVLGDMLLVRPGDQIVVDGMVVGDGKMDVDESLLTGESDLIAKQRGTQVFSGSFCVNGSATYEATKVGLDSFANKLTLQAKQFRVVRTPLQQDINLVVRLLLFVASTIGILFAVAYGIRNVSMVQSVQSAAVIAGLVPAGLILMTTTSYAIGALRMSGKGALIQQANAVESLSNVDVLCLDKTGTLTANRIHVHALHPLTVAMDELTAIFGDMARSATGGNRTTEAIISGCKGIKRTVVDEIPFSSARKWSALVFNDGERRGTYVMGAPEMIQSYLERDDDFGKGQIDSWSSQGLRVMMVAHSPTILPLHDGTGAIVFPNDLKSVGLISLGDELRAEARETIENFMKAGITLKIISGDNPHTVGALAKQAGFTGDVRVVSGLDLDKMDATQLAKTVNETTIFGRITPQQKELLVTTLREQGHYVAMIGDGVNDVLSLKKAHIGIAMQSGSAATRGVADMVLLNDSFAALPKAFMEGQRILNGMDAIIRLFLSRAFYAAMILIGASLMVGATNFPFIPKHASLLTLLSVGIPTLGIAAWARVGVPTRDLMRDLIHFILPAAMSIAGVALSIYVIFFHLYVYSAPPDMITVAVNTARTALTTAIIFMGLGLIVFVEPPLKFLAGGSEFSGDWRPTITAGVMLVIYFLIVLIPPTRQFFELEMLTLSDYALIGAIVVAWGIALRLIWRFKLIERFLGISLKRPSHTT
jgi:cation-transporting ATPase E